MKKEYINPTTEIIMIETAQIIAASPYPEYDEENSVDPDGGEDVVQLSRRRSVWDVDEEEW